MELLKNFFMRSPGGENEGGGNTSDDVNTEESTDENAAHAEEEHPHEKGILGKIKDALKDWSAKDQQDQAFDDTRV